MKNPLKSAGEKLRSLAQKFSPPQKPETAKTFVDGLGDSGIIGGLALIGTAAFMTAAPSTMLLAGGAFVLGGVTTKIAASRMKPATLDVTAPEKPDVPVPVETPSTLAGKTLGPAFKNANDDVKTEVAAKPAPKPRFAPKP